MKQNRKAWREVKRRPTECTPLKCIYLSSGAALGKALGSFQVGMPRLYTGSGSIEAALIKMP